MITYFDELLKKTDKMRKDYKWVKRYLKFKGKCKNEPEQVTNLKLAVWTVIWCLTDMDEWAITFKDVKTLLQINTKRQMWVYEEAYSGVGATEEKKEFLSGKTFEKLMQDVMLEPYNFCTTFINILDIFVSINRNDKFPYEFIGDSKKTLMGLIQ